MAHAGQRRAVAVGDCGAADAVKDGPAAPGEVEEHGDHDEEGMRDDEARQADDSDPLSMPSPAGIRQLSPQ